MRYTGDYRRLVWCEAADGSSGSADAVTQVGRTVHLGSERVVCCGLG